LVFIGVDWRRKEIETALDDRLFTDDEMEEYRMKLENIRSISAEAAQHHYDGFPCSGKAF